MFVRSLGNSQRANPGFETERAAVAVMDLSLGGYPETEAGLSFLERYRQNIASSP